jgi:hypothetical protein
MTTQESRNTAALANEVVRTYGLMFGSILPAELSDEMRSAAPQLVEAMEVVQQLIADGALLVTKAEGMQP